MDTIDKRQLEPLLRRALAGDACAWNEFFRQIRKHLHAETRKVLGPGVEGLVEHSVVVQSTLRRAWERIGDIFPDGPRDGALGRFLAWITTIVRNRSKDELRRLIRERARTAGSAIEDVPGRPDADRPGSANRLPWRSPRRWPCFPKKSGRSSSCSGLKVCRTRPSANVWAAAPGPLPCFVAGPCTAPNPATPLLAGGIP